MRFKVGFILLSLLICVNSTDLSKSSSSNGFFCTVCTDTVKLAEKIFGANIIKKCLPQFIEYMCEILKIQGNQYFLNKLKFNYIFQLRPHDLHWNYF